MTLNLTRENRLSNAYLVEIDNMNTKLDDFYVLLDQKADPASDLRLTGIKQKSHSRVNETLYCYSSV
jgi:hypothetical protein